MVVARPGMFEKAALVGSLGLVVVGLWWLASPAAYPFGTGDRYADLSLLSGVSARSAAWVALASGLVSAAAAALCWTAPAAWPRLRLVPLVVSVPMAVTYAYLVPDIQLLILVAYGLTLSLPAAGVFLVVARRDVRRAVVVALVTLVATVLGLVVLGRPWEWGDGGEPGSAGLRPVVLMLALATGIGWAGLGVRAHRALRGRCLRCGRPGPAWTSVASAARWGRVVTWAAALTPLPYVVARLTWLTPWPYGESPEHLAAHPGLWLFGLGLAVAGEVGTWLTLGLVEERGEVVPRWVPVRGGRPVPVAAAVVPGFAIALLMCVGGHSVVQQAFGPGTTWEDHSLVVLVPLPLWGPLLALGTLAYWYRRRPACALEAQRSALSVG